MTVCGRVREMKVADGLPIVSPAQASALSSRGAPCGYPLSAGACPPLGDGIQQSEQMDSCFRKNYGLRRLFHSNNGVGREKAQVQHSVTIETI